MLLTRLHASGLALPVDFQVLDAATKWPRAPDASVAADALTIWRAGLVGGDAALVLTELGWEVAAPAFDAFDLEDPSYEPSDDDVWDVDAAEVDPVLAIGGGDVQVDVSVAPDPPLYGRLREHAVRDPRLVTALGQEAELHVKVGLRHLRGGGSVSLDVLGARIGDVAFPIVGKERPHWLLPFLGTVARRVRRLDLSQPPPWPAMLASGLSRDPEQQQRWQRALSALEEDFGLPRPRLVLEHGTPGLVFGDAHWPSRLLDRAGRDALHLVSVCFLEQPDVLVSVDPLPEAHRTWLDARTEGDDAVLEQVLSP